MVVVEHFIRYGVLPSNTCKKTLYGSKKHALYAEVVDVCQHGTFVILSLPLISHKLKYFKKCIQVQAVNALVHVDIVAAFLSMIFNFLNRKHDFSNTCVLAMIIYATHWFFWYSMPPRFLTCNFSEEQHEFCNLETSRSPTSS